MEFYRLLKKNILTHFFTKLFYLFSGKGAKPAAAPKKEPAAKPSGPRNNHYYFAFILVNVSSDLQCLSFIFHLFISIGNGWRSPLTPTLYIFHYLLFCFFMCTGIQ